LNTELEQQQTSPPEKPLGTFPKLLWALLLAAPALWLGYLVFRYGVDVPYFDHWFGVCPLFEKMDAGTLRAADFWEFHNGHRILFPRLIFFGLAKLTHWNVRVEMFVTWLLAVACALNVWRLARATGWPSGTGYGLFFLANVLVFTPLEQENWLFGFCIQLVLPVACTTGALWVARALRFPASFVLSMILCLVATYSVASGFISWLLVGALLFLLPGETHWRRRKWWCLVWVLVFVASCGMYFQGFAAANDPEHPITDVFKHPIFCAHFFLVFLGSAFAHGTSFDALSVATSMGGVLMLLVVGATAYVWRWRREAMLLTQALPWFMMILVGILNGAITTARFYQGLEHALMGRYLVFSLMVPVGLLFLGALIWRHWRATVSEDKSQAVRLALTSLVTAFFLLHGLGVVKNVQTWGDAQHRRLITKALLLMINVISDHETLLRNELIDDDPPLKFRANLLNRLRYLRPRLVRSNFIREIAGRSPTGPAAFGQIETAGNTANGRFGMAGWAVLPEKRRPADAVLLTYDDPRGEGIIFDLAIVEIPRPDIATTFRRSSYRLSGWTKTFNPKLLPEKARLLKAWAFDADEGRAYPIHGSVNLVR